MTTITVSITEAQLARLQALAERTEPLWKNLLASASRIGFDSLATISKKLHRKPSKRTLKSIGGWRDSLSRSSIASPRAIPSQFLVGRNYTRMLSWLDRDN